MKDKYVFFYLPGWQTVGYCNTNTGEFSKHDFEPFGDMPGYGDQGEAWHDSYADSLEDAVAKLKEWMNFIGLRGEPIVTEALDYSYAPPSGDWTPDHVQAIVLDELMNCGFLPEDIFRGCKQEDEEDESIWGWWATSIIRMEYEKTREEKILLRMPFERDFPILPHTTDADIRREVRRWIYFTKSHWEKQENFEGEEGERLQKIKKLFSATYRKWAEQHNLSGFLSVVEAAERSGYERRHLTLLCRQGKLPGAMKKDGGWWIPVEALDNYVPGPRGFPPGRGKKKEEKEEN